MMFRMKVDPSEELKREDEKKEMMRLEQLQRQKAHYEQKQGKIAQLTKEIDAYYNMFVETHQKLDFCLINGGQADYAQADQKMNEILRDIENMPSLIAIFPHMIKYIFEKYVSCSPPH